MTSNWNRTVTQRQSHAINSKKVFLKKNYLHKSKEIYILLKYLNDKLGSAGIIFLHILASINGFVAFKSRSLRKVVLRVRMWCNVKPPAVMSNAGNSTAVTRGRSMISCSS